MDAAALIAYNGNAERSLLGAVFLRPDALERVLHIAPRDFHHPAHRVIWEAILSLHADEAPFDAVTIADRLGDRLTFVGGMTFLAGLTDDVPTADNVEHYARIVSGDSLTRRARMGLEQLAGDRRLEAEDLLAEVRRLLARLEPAAVARAHQGTPFAEDLRALVGAEEPTEEDVPSPEDWVIPGLVPRQGLTVIGGPPKASKTFFLLDMGLAVTTGQPLCGRWPVFKGRVLSILEEDPKRRIRGRLWWLARGRGLDPRELGSEFRLAVMNRFRLDNPDALAQLEAEIAEYKPDVVQIDALARVHSADENDRTAMRAVTVPLQDICARHGIAIVLVHHFRGLRDDDHEKRAGELLRGTTDLYALARSVIGLRKRQGALALDASGNDGEIPFQHLDLFIGKDDHGRNIARFTSRGSETQAEVATDADAVLALIAASPEGLTTDAVRNLIKEKSLKIGKDRLAAALAQLEDSGSIRRYTPRAPWQAREVA